MPTTRPGFIWSGTEWIAIGQEAVLAPVSYQATAPTTPATGDIWIESDVDVPSIDSAQFLRWRKTMTGGETSLSGNDDSSLPLAYTPGYEQLYINGVLQVRGQDYTATTGTTVTGLTALVANDVVEIFSAVARTVADVYTQTQSDARFVNKSVGGLNLVVPTSVTGGTVNANGAITIGSAVSSVNILNSFSTTYDAYKIILVDSTLSVNGATFHWQLTAGGTQSTTGYSYGITAMDYAANALQYQRGSNVGQFISGYAVVGGETVSTTFELLNPFAAKATHLIGLNYVGNANGYGGMGAGRHDVAASYNGLRLSASSGTITGGTIRIYGYNNGV